MKITNHIELVGTPLKDLDVGDTFTKNGVLYVLCPERLSVNVESGVSCSFDGVVIVTPVRVELDIHPVAPLARFGVPAY